MCLNACQIPWKLMEMETNINYRNYLVLEEIVLMRKFLQNHETNYES